MGRSAPLVFPSIPTAAKRDDFVSRTYARKNADRKSTYPHPTQYLLKIGRLPDNPAIHI